MAKNSETTGRQLTFDLGEASGRQPSVRKKRETTKHTARPRGVVEVLPPSGAAVQLAESPGTPAQRETEAFRLYQAQQRHVFSVCFTAVVFALALVAVKFLGAQVEANPVGGVKLVVENKQVLAGLLGYITLGSALWALYSLYVMRALWRKCGFSYRDIMRPSDNVAVLWLIRFVGTIVVGLILLIIVVALGYSLPDMFAVVKIAFQNIMRLPSGTWEPEIHKC